MAQVFLWGEAERYQNYRAAAAASGGTLLCSRDMAAAEGCGGLLLPGGGDLEPSLYGQANTASRELEPERDQAELALLRRFAALGRPVLGICRGLQTINVGFGGTLYQDIPGHGALDSLDRLHPTAAAGFLAALYGPAPTVNSAHHQAAARLGRGLRAVQWAADGTVEALCHQTLPIWAVQWHPERLRGAFSRPGAVNGDVLFQYFLSKTI